MKKINKVLYQNGVRWLEPEKHPMIRIANNYLKKAGFEYGNKIEVEYQKGKVIIVKL